MAQLALQLRADPIEITRMRESLESFAERQGLPEEVVFKLTLVLDELVANAINYGFDGIAHPEIHVRIELDRATDRDDRALVLLRDNGRAFDPFSEAPAPDLDSPLEQRRVGGLGVHFVRTMMEQVSYRRDGEWNVIEMGMRVEGEAG